MGERCLKIYETIYFIDEGDVSTDRPLERHESRPARCRDEHIVAALDLCLNTLVLCLFSGQFCGESLL